MYKIDNARKCHEYYLRNCERLRRAQREWYWRNREKVIAEKREDRELFKSLGLHFRCMKDGTRKWVP
jgi:hypothetical protein